MDAVVDEDGKELSMQCHVEEFLLYSEYNRES